jgi:hypothetical protein
MHRLLSLQIIGQLSIFYIEQLLTIERITASDSRANTSTAAISRLEVFDYSYMNAIPMNMQYQPTIIRIPSNQ